MLFNISSTITDGQNAFDVIGQDDFTSNVSAISQSRITGAQRIVYDTGNSRLYYFTGSRIPILNFVRITTASLPAGTTGDEYYQLINTSSSQGTVSLAVAGEQAISISQVLTPGLYWFAFFGGVAAATVGAISANEEGLTALICGTSAAALTSDCTSTVTQALAYAAFPATATPVANINGAANPNVAVRRSA